MELFFFNPIFSAFMTFGFLFGFKTSFQERLVKFFLGYSDSWINYKIEVRKKRIEGILERFKSSVSYGNEIRDKKKVIKGFEIKSKSVGETVEEYYEKLYKRFAILSQTDNFSGLSFFIAMFCLSMLFASGYLRNGALGCATKSLFFETLFLYQILIGLIVVIIFILDCGIIKKTWLSPTKTILIYFITTILLLGHFYGRGNVDLLVNDLCVELTPIIAGAPFLLYFMKVLLGATIIRIVNKFYKKSVDNAINELEKTALMYEQATMDKQAIEKQLSAIIDATEINAEKK